jgi:hypothetical protein
VLEACKEALEKYTDIKFTYEPIGKKGKGAKVNSLRFIISKNENYADMLSLFSLVPTANSSLPITSTFFTFTALYLASGLPIPNGREGTDWKPSQRLTFCSLPRNTCKLSHRTPYLFVFSLWLMHQRVN